MCRARAGRPLGEARITAGLLERAPARVLTRYLDQVEAWIGQGRPEPALALLAAFIEAGKLMADETWRPRIVELNRRAAERMAKLPHVPIAAQFPRTARRYPNGLDAYLTRGLRIGPHVQPRSSPDLKAA